MKIASTLAVVAVLLQLFVTQADAMGFNDLANITTSDESPGRVDSLRPRDGEYADEASPVPALLGNSVKQSVPAPVPAPAPAVASSGGKGGKTTIVSDEFTPPTNVPPSETTLHSTQAPVTPMSSLSVATSDGDDDDDGDDEYTASAPTAKATPAPVTPKPSPTVVNSDDDDDNDDDGDDVETNATATPTPTPAILTTPAPVTPKPAPTTPAPISNAQDDDDDGDDSEGDDASSPAIVPTPAPVPANVLAGKASDGKQSSFGGQPWQQNADQRPPGTDTEPNVNNGGVNLFPYTPEIRDYIVDQHNFARATMAPQEAANMRKLAWHEALAIEASELVNTCVFEHDTENYAYGQNLMYGNDVIDQTTVQNWMKAWVVNEISDSDRTGNGFMDLDHASAVLWAKSYFVGCASKRCPNGYLTACNYHTPGNWQGEQVFVPGPACSQCPSQAQHCDAQYGKLCTADPSGKPAPAAPAPKPTPATTSATPKPTPAKTSPAFKPVPAPVPTPKPTPAKTGPVPKPAQKPAAQTTKNTHKLCH